MTRSGHPVPVVQVQLHLPIQNFLHWTLKSGIEQHLQLVAEKKIIGQGRVLVDLQKFWDETGLSEL
jgi:hypothetical protein